MKKKTIIIAEIGVNHNGSLHLAKRLIDKAKASGADFAKFQVFNIDEIAHIKASKANYQSKAIGKKITQLEMLKKLNLSYDQHLTLNKYSKRKKIKYLASGFSKKDFLFLKKIGCEYLKIPSGEITNLNLLKFVGSLKKRIIISTGASTILEIKTAIKYLIKGGMKISNVSLLHCNSAYPTPLKDCNLNAIKTLKNLFKTEVGYSDHSNSVDAPAVAVALGASIIEKHLTLKNTMIGPDHKASLSPNNFKLMVRKIYETELMMGNGFKEPKKSEIKNKKFIRRGIYAKVKILKNEQFTEKNIFCLRPLGKLGAENWFKVIGKKSKRKFEKYQQIIL